MKKISLSLLLCLAILSFTACKKEQQIISKKVIQEKIDSIVNIRIKELDANAQRDLDHRITIEVKVKADSIFQARMKKDTQNIKK